MFIRDGERIHQPNWLAIVSYTASVALSVAIWGIVIRGVEYVVKIAAN